MEIEFENFALQDCSKLLSKTKTQIRDRKELSYNIFMAIFILLMKFGTRKCPWSTTFQKLLLFGTAYPTWMIGIDLDLGFGLNSSHHNLRNVNSESST